MPNTKPNNNPQKAYDEVVFKSHNTENYQKNKITQEILKEQKCFENECFEFFILEIVLIKGRGDDERG